MGLESLQFKQAPNRGQRGWSGDQLCAALYTAGFQPVLHTGTMWGVLKTTHARVPPPGILITLVWGEARASGFFLKPLT